MSAHGSNQEEHCVDACYTGKIRMFTLTAANYIDIRYVIHDTGGKPLVEVSWPFLATCNQTITTSLSSSNDCCRPTECAAFWIGGTPINQENFVAAPTLHPGSACKCVHSCVHSCSTCEMQSLTSLWIFFSSSFAPTT